MEIQNVLHTDSGDQRIYKIYEFCLIAFRNNAAKRTAAFTAAY
jgi:hypothetical protein